MKTSMLILLILFYSTLSYPESRLEQSIPSGLEQKLAQVNSKEVAKVAVLYYPEDLMTEIGITPKHLEEIYWSATVIRRFQDSEFKLRFLSSLRESAVRQGNKRAVDLRWACIFYDNKDARLVTFYFEKSGAGLVDDIPIASNGALLEFLRSKCAFR